MFLRKLGKYQMISPTELTEFDTNGFVVLRQFVRGNDLEHLIAKLDGFMREVVPAMPPEHVFYEDKSDRSTLKQLQQLGQYDAWFHELFTSGRTRQLAETLLRGTVVPKNIQYFNKPPGLGRPTPPHQDGYYFMLEPCEAITMWLALEEVDEDNGCVRYVPGSHKLGMRKHTRTNTLGFSQGIVDYPNEHDRLGELALPAQSGDLLVHHAMTIHRADENRSPDRSRRALGFIYYSHRAHEDTDAHQAYQRELAKQMTATGRI